MISVRFLFFFLKDGIGLDAINDAFLLESSIYRLLRRHCRNQPYYVNLLELFNEVSRFYFGQDKKSSDDGWMDILEIMRACLHIYIFI